MQVQRNLTVLRHLRSIVIGVADGSIQSDPSAAWTQVNLVATCKY